MIPAPFPSPHRGEGGGEGVSNLDDWNLFEIWCLGFGAYHFSYALCSMLYAMLFSTNSVMSIALMGISFLRAVVRIVRTHC